MARQRLWVAGSSRRLTAWGLGPSADRLTLGVLPKQVWSVGAALVGEARTTVVRIRGIFQIWTTSVTAVSDGFLGAIGIGVATADAFGVGLTALPGPLTDVEWPGWMYHEFLSVHQQTATVADGVNSAASQQRGPIDSKAMRKFGENEVLFGMIEVEEDGAAVGTFRADTRILVKLT